MSVLLRSGASPRRDTGHYLTGGLIVFAVVAISVWFLPSYYTGLVTQIGIYALVAIGLNLFMGYAGQVSLGQAAFVGLGAYTSAILAVNLHWTPWIGIVAGACVRSEER